MSFEAKLIALAAAASFSVGAMIGCAMDYYPAHYDVYVAADVPAAPVRNALDMWTEHAGVQFTMHTGVAGCSPKHTSSGEGCISLHLDSLADLGYESPGIQRIGYTACTHPGSCDIYLASEKMWHDDLVYTTALVGHEVGHALGLVHHKGNVLMNPIIHDGAMTVQCDDVQQYYDLRGWGKAACPTEDGDERDAGGD